MMLRRPNRPNQSDVGQFAPMVWSFRGVSPLLECRRSFKCGGSRSDVRAFRSKLWAGEQTPAQLQWSDWE